MRYGKTELYSYIKKYLSMRTLKRHTNINDVNESKKLLLNCVQEYIPIGLNNFEVGWRLSFKRITLEILSSNAQHVNAKDHTSPNLFTV